MATYRKKIPEVQAFQFTKENYDHPDSWPTWATEALSVGKIKQSGTRGLYVPIGYFDGFFRTIYFGDYLMQDEYGNIEVIEQSAFERTFEEK